MKGEPVDGGGGYDRDVAAEMLDYLMVLAYFHLGKRQEKDRYGGF